MENKDSYTINLFDKGKLTINHFLYDINKKKDEHPIYIQVIFNRKTTQVKSCITEKFENFTDAQNKYSEVIKAEKELIKDLILEISKEKTNVSLKGLSSIIQKYHQNAFLYFSEKLVKRVKDEIIRYSDHFMYDITPVNQIYDIKYLEECRRYHGDNEFYDKIKPMFKLKEVIMDVAYEIEKESSFKTTIFYWLYLGGQDYFSKKAKELNMEEGDIIDAVNAIATEIYFL